MFSRSRVSAVLVSLPRPLTSSTLARDRQRDGESSCYGRVTQTSGCSSAARWPRAESTARSVGDSLWGSLVLAGSRKGVLSRGRCRQRDVADSSERPSGGTGTGPEPSNTGWNLFTALRFQRFRITQRIRMLAYPLENGPWDGDEWKAVTRCDNIDEVIGTYHLASCVLHDEYVDMHWLTESVRHDASIVVYKDGILFLSSLPADIHETLFLSFSLSLFLSR